MKSLLLVFISLIMLSCSSQNKSDDQKDDDKIKIEHPETVDKNELMHMDGNDYTEYYPDKINIKFKGTYDDDHKRHGKWLYYSEDGEELSMTIYEHGLKHGHSIVKYPNGQIHYYGEYRNDKQIGIWKSYSIKGELTDEKDYGEVPE